MMSRFDSLEIAGLMVTATACLVCLVLAFAWLVHG